MHFDTQIYLVTTAIYVTQPPTRLSTELLALTPWVVWEGYSHILPEAQFDQPIHATIHLSHHSTYRSVCCYQ